MQIGIENLTLAQHLALIFLGLLDLYHHIGASKNLRRRGNNLRTSRHIVAIREINRRPSIRFDNYLMPTLSQLIDRCWRQPHTVLMIFNLFRNTYQHSLSPF